MSLPVFLRAGAEADAHTARSELESVRAGLGRQFISRLREVLERIESMPQLYGVVWQDVHAARVKRFRYIVYYVVLSDRVEVLAIMHGSRDAMVWRSRT